MSAGRPRPLGEADGFRRRSPTPRASPAPGQGRSGSVQALQRAVGNRAVSALLGPVVVQRQDGSGGARGPEVVPGNGTTAELQAELDRLRREQRALHVSTIEPESERRYNEYVGPIRRLGVLIAERGGSGLADADVELVFDGSALVMAGAASRSWAAVSGRPDSSGAFDNSPARQRMEGVGPIPAGGYWLDPRQLIDLSDRWLYSLRYEAPWGTHRITIHPFDTTHTFGRGGFFIHGGATPGSAGCIDLTSAMASFARVLGAVPPGRKVKLTVRYPQGPSAAATW